MLTAAAIKAEREELARQLRADPRTDPRILQILALIDLEPFYTAEQKTGSPKTSGAITRTEGAEAEWRDRQQGIAPSRGVGKINRAVDPDRVKVMEHVANLIRGSGNPVRTADIYEALPADVRSLIRGEAPKNNLSAMLHNAQAFVSCGRAGWLLREDYQQVGEYGGPDEEPPESPEDAEPNAPAPRTTLELLALPPGVRHG